MRSVIVGILCLSVSLPLFINAQRVDSPEIAPALSSNYVRSIAVRSESINAKIARHTADYLNQLQEQEQTLQRKLSKIDSGAASRIFRGSALQYEKLQTGLRNNSKDLLRSYGKYLPGIDSAVTSLKFLQQGALANPKLAGQLSRIKTALANVKQLEDQFKKAGNVEEFIRQRQQYLKQQLSSYNLGSALSKYNQQTAYYFQEVSELKQSWSDPSRMEQKALTVLNKLPAFRDFMRKTSLFGNLFNIPDDYAATGLAGLQTRDAVQQLMQQRMELMGPNGGQTAQQNIGNAQTLLTGLRNRIQQTGSADGMPETKINNQHTKSLFKRLVFGVDAQNNRSNYFIPLSTEFAVTCGYRLNNKSVAGIGISYSVSWGSDIRHISISNNAVGVRSFLDVQLKGSIYASGAVEYNYAHVFQSLNDLRSKRLWQPSGLIGVSKVIPLRTGILKQTRVQLFWDPVSYMISPQTQHFKLRFGYNF